MELPAILKAVLAGKRVFVTRESGPRNTTSELRTFIGRFPVSDTLRVIGDAAAQVEAAPPNTIMTIEDEPVPLHCLPYLALLSIEESNDSLYPSSGFRTVLCSDTGLMPVSIRRVPGITSSELATAVRMFHNLQEPIQEEADGSGDAAYEFMIRMGQAQFAFQGGLDHLLARTVLLYRDVWPTEPKASSLSPLATLRALTGLDLEQILAFARAFHAKSLHGYFEPYGDRTLRDLPNPLASLLTVDAQRKFLAWISADYETIRRKGAQHIPPNASYDRYRLNPLLEYPLVRPEVPPVLSECPTGPIYLLPCPRLVLLRATRGLYHDLSNQYAGQIRDNPFKTAFGHVFQRYVGLLLKAAFGADYVFDEWRYGDGVDTPDWIVIDENRAVLIEVKQSAQYLPSKMWGHLDEVEKELRRTLGHAMSQLHRFERDLARGVKGLERLTQISRTERLIVTHDDVSWANWVIREAARKAMCLPDDFSAHVAPIDDFERLLAYCWQGSLFDTLEQKRHGDQNEANMDFNDWISSRVGSGGERRNPYIDGRFQDLMRSWGIP